MTGFGLGMLFGAIAVSAVLIGSGIVLRLQRISTTVIPALLAFASGTLLGAACFGLIPEAATTLSLDWVMRMVLVAIVGFFLLEKWVLFRHCHGPSCPVHAVAGYLILIGDGIHNAVDGLMLGATFAADPHLGVSVGIAILAHEVPQEVGDFALLTDGGLSPRRALAYNLLSAATVFPGVIVGYALVELVESAVGVALAIAAGGFFYVALADLVPDLHRRERAKTLQQLLPLLGGVIVIVLAGML
jgi:zinc and cadmium transporter